MMPTSRPNNSCFIQQGFSLLEMLLVLAIMGIVLSMIGVRLVASIESTRFIRTAEAAMADIKLIRLQAMLDDKAILISGSQGNSGSTRPADVQIIQHNLPVGWTVTGDIITISRTGFCSGGQVSLKDETERKIDFLLTPPKCEAKRIVTLAPADAP